MQWVPVDFVFVLNGCDRQHNLWILYELYSRMGALTYYLHDPSNGFLHQAFGLPATGDGRLPTCRADKLTKEVVWLSLNFR
jgi:hypothetical protein